MLSCFDTLLECDRWTDRRTEWLYRYHKWALLCWRV